MPDAPFDFDTLAETYERLGEPLTRSFSLDALALAGLPAGATVLDVAAGTGALAIPAARAGLTVLASDLAPGMVARLAAKLAPYPGSVAAIGDCTALDAVDGGAAAAFSLFGVCILPVWHAGLAEMVRVTQPGGLVVVGAWLEDRGSKPFLVLRQAFSRLFPDRSFMPDDAFPAWTAVDLREALAAAGCTEVTVHARTHDIVKSSAEVATADTMPFAGMMAGIRALAPEELARLEAGVTEGYHAYVAADGTIRLPMEALIGVGRVAT